MVTKVTMGQWSWSCKMITITDWNLLTTVEVLECCQWNVLVWLSGRLCWACAELESAH